MRSSKEQAITINAEMPSEKSWERLSSFSLLSSLPFYLLSSSSFGLAVTGLHITSPLDFAWPVLSPPFSSSLSGLSCLFKGNVLYIFCPQVAWKLAGNLSFLGLTLSSFKLQVSLVRRRFIREVIDCLE